MGLKGILYMFTFLMLVSEIKYFIKNGGGESYGHQDADEDKKVRGNYVSLALSC